MTTTPPAEQGPLVSVFTPSHDPRFLSAAWATLRHQTYSRWEWLVLLNGGATWSPPAPDQRVRVISDGTVAGVGAAKARAVEECRGEILLELDHDDLLATDALAAVVDAFAANPDAGLVYSHAAAVDEAGQSTHVQYDSAQGWSYGTANVDGLDVAYPITPEPTPHNVALIWFAPNHLRAFSRVAYDKAGGYNPDFDVLDDADLMCRLFEVGPFVLVDQVLYLQRLHGARTSAGPDDQPQTDANARIQVGTVELYDRYIERLALAWAEREGLVCLDLGGAHGLVDQRYLSVDQHPGPGVDVVHTFPDPLDGIFGDGSYRLGDSTVGVIRAFDFLEHVADKTALIAELHRLLVPGGMLLTYTPAAPGGGAFQDPTHVAFYNQASFRYYTEPAMRAFVAELVDADVRFQVSRLVTWPPPLFGELRRLLAAGGSLEDAVARCADLEAQLPYVTANLIAVKDDMPSRNGGHLLW